MPDNFICELDALPEEGGCKEFELGDDSFFIVRQWRDVFVYRNSCPHIGTPLNWQEDKFLDSENRFIQCFSHGALFEIDSGLCVAGPCQGQALQQVEHALIEGKIYIKDDPSPLV